MRATSLALVCMCSALAIAACGGGGRAPVGSPPPKAEVPLAAAPTASGEVVVKGEASPEQHGPITLEGRYRVRFEQTAPEDPSIDFTAETPFVARVITEGARDRGRVLFRAAAAKGARSITLRGAYLVDVEFGDWPYAIRFTPAG